MGCVSALTVYSQSTLVFEKTSHDFGTIEEQGGFAEVDFKFLNAGDAPIKINNVKASCGCTTPGWTKEEVMPGDSGFVKARYNPRNRPGKFRKSLKITTSQPSADQTLYISGMVQPKPKSPEQSYPFEVGKLRLKQGILNLGTITNEKRVEKSFTVFNGSDSLASLIPEDVTIPSHIELRLTPESIEPGAFGKITVIYDPQKKNDFGYASDNIKLDKNTEESISVIAIIEEYFPEMTAEELAKAPKIMLNTPSFQFEKVKPGTLLEKSFEIVNKGKEKLQIRTIKSNCECVTYDINKKSIKSGKKATMKVMFDTTGMVGSQYKSIVIYSNDPEKSSQIISINGKVTE